MKNQSIVFAKPGVVEFKDTELDTKNIASGKLVIKTESSILSAGTELAILRGTEWWAPLPFIPGYGAVGTVVEKGSGLDHIAVGDRVFTHSRHASYAISDVMITKVPAGLPSNKAVFARMAQISMVSRRIADAQIGDYVAVYGLGLVGNLAAQLFMLSGCEVIGIDLAAKRRALAKTCGINHVIDASSDVVAEIKRITGGRMCRTVVEATGVPAVAAKVSEAAGKLGEVILLGSPRGEYMADVTALLNRTHLWDNGCITIKGAHEWRLPINDDAAGRPVPTFESNVDAIFRFMANGRLKIDELTTQVASPRDCVAIYDGVRNKKDDYIGVVFDWKK